MAKMNTQQTHDTVIQLTTIRYCRFSANNDSRVKGVAGVRIEASVGGEVGSADGDEVASADAGGGMPSPFPE